MPRQGGLFHALAGFVRSQASYACLVKLHVISGEAQLLQRPQVFLLRSAGSERLELECQGS